MSRRGWLSLGGLLLGLAGVWGACALVLRASETPTVATDKFSTADQLVFYRLEPGERVRLRLPLDADSVRVVSHLMLPTGATYAADRQYVYGVQFKLVDDKYRALIERPLFTRTRQSKAEPSEQGFLKESAFTLDPNAQLTDGRDFLLELPAERRTGRVWVELRNPGPTGTVLLRAYARTRADGFFGSLKSRDYRGTWAKAERATFLPFEKLSPVTQEQLKRERWMPLGAEGEAEQDYRTERVYRTDFRLPLVEAGSSDQESLLPGRAIAVNVRGPTALTVRLWSETPAKAPISRGEATISVLREDGAHERLAIPSAGAGRARDEAHRASRGDLLGAARERDRRRAALPRRGREEPLGRAAGARARDARRGRAAAPAPGPERGLGRRSGLSRARARPRGARRGRGAGAPARRARARGAGLGRELPRSRSRSSTSRAGRSTPTRSASTSPPPRSSSPRSSASRASRFPARSTRRRRRRRALRSRSPRPASSRSPRRRAPACWSRSGPGGCGSPRTARSRSRSRATSTRPGTPSADAPYDAPLASEDVRWRKAAMSDVSWHPLRPRNHEALVPLAARIALVGQVHLEATGDGPVSLPTGVPVVVVPSGSPRPLELLERQPEDSGVDAGREVLSWLSTAKPSPVLFDPRTRSRPELRLRLDNPTSLGRPVEVLVDGQVIHRTVLRTTRGRELLPPIPPGKHEVQLRSDAAGLEAILNRPSAGDPTLRTRTVYALSQRKLRVPVMKRARGAVTLNVILYAPTAEAAPGEEVRVSIDRGMPERRRSLFIGKLTRAERAIPVPASDRPEAISLGEPRPKLYPRRVAVTLGDDLAPGLHWVELEGAGELPLWARFFVYGQTGHAPAEQWTRPGWESEDAL